MIKSRFMKFLEILELQFNMIKNLNWESKNTNVITKAYFIISSID